MTILKPDEEAVLMALADACDYSLGAHVPREFVRKKCFIRCDVDKLLRKLRAKRYCQEHPTGGSTTWQLTLFGLQEAKMLLERGL
jgi:hypothetical protein